MLGLERNEILRDVDAFNRWSHGALWCVYCYDTKNPKETALFWVNASFAFFLLCTVLGLPSARVNGHSSMASDLPGDLFFSGALFSVVPAFATYFSFSVWCRGRWEERNGSSRSRSEDQTEAWGLWCSIEVEDTGSSPQWAVCLRKRTRMWLVAPLRRTSAGSILHGVRVASGSGRAPERDRVM